MRKKGSFSLVFKIVMRFLEKAIQDLFACKCIYSIQLTEVRFDSNSCCWLFILWKHLKTNLGCSLICKLSFTSGAQCVGRRRISYILYRVRVRFFGTRETYSAFIKL